MDVINNQGNPQYKYYYTTGESVEVGMKEALSKY